MKLAPYPEYKESGMPWLGKMPAHWEAIKTKYVFRERVQKGYPKESLLAATQTKGVVPKSIYENRTVEAQKDLHLLKLVETGDFVISLRSFQGGIEYAYYRGIISPAYTVIVPNKRILPAYFRHLGKSKKFISLLQTCVTGIREGQNINYAILRKTPIPVPTEEEQTQIARFLDWKTAQINKFIRNKRRLIELLKEQKQNVINQAVTRGLDPKVKFKPSGVEWIGDIPEHWEVMRIKFLFAEREERKGDTEFKLLSFSRSKGLVPFAEISSKPPSAEDLSKYKVCQPGHFLMNRMQAWSGMFTDVAIEGVVSPDYSVFEPIRPMSVAYFSYLFKTKRHVDEFAMASKGIGDGFNRLYTPAFGAIRTLCPPVDEQNAIVEFIKQETAIIDVAISRAEQEIELMREYRTRLISDVVTGQVDVRNMKCEGGSLNEDEFEDIEEVEEEIELPEGGEDDE
jgi:type I restriction enzyme S subunit